jgi:hypothetical protein
MRKLFLLLFLFALTSNALAKVEIWECDGDYFKIDTDIPTVYKRINSRWIDGSNASEMKDYDNGHFIFKYSRKDEAIYWIRSDTKEYVGVMDLFKKEIYKIKKDGDYKLRDTCKLYVR